MKSSVTARHILYVGQPPAQGTGSPIVIWRHLRRLAAEGWKVSVVGQRGRSGVACEREGWSVIDLPLRRPWWPPYREGHPEWLRRVRQRLLAREAIRRLAAPPDAVLGYLAAHEDFGAELAAACAAALRRPLTLLIHDDAAAFEPDALRRSRLRARHARLLAAARVNWFVTPALAAACPAPPDRRAVLPPLPEGWTGPLARPAAAEAPPRIYYAGHLWPAQVPLLARLARLLDRAGARLVVIARPGPALADLTAEAPLEQINPFAENRDALAHLAAHASAVLVSYAETVAAMPWSATSFPSKLAEFCHLGLPVAVVAPRETAVGAWTEQAGLPDFFEPAALEPAFSAWAASLRDPAVWTARADRSRALAAGEFSPERIHRVFADALVA